MCKLIISPAAAAAIASAAAPAVAQAAPTDAPAHVVATGGSCSTCYRV